MSESTVIRRTAVPADRFVVVWNESPTLADFCKATGMSPQAASSRAVALRKKVNLKKHARGIGSNGGRRNDYDKLNELANAALATAAERTQESAT